MTLLRTNPFDEFFIMSNRILDNALDNLDSFWGVESTDYPTNTFYNEDKSELVLEYALAGFSKDEVKVKVVGDRLTVSATSAEKTKKEDDPYGYRGIAQRNFKKSYRVSAGLNKENVKATFKDGLLRVVLSPKEKEVHEVKIG